MLLSLERFTVQRQLGSSSESIAECEGKKKEGTKAKNSFVILTDVRTGGPRWVSPLGLLFDCIHWWASLNISMIYVFVLIWLVLRANSQNPEAAELESLFCLILVTNLGWIGCLFSVMPSSFIIYFLSFCFGNVGWSKASVVMLSTFRSVLPILLLSLYPW